jgi:hypothetical protein
MARHPGKPERYQSARIAGYEGMDGRWHNVEAGARHPTERSTRLSRHITVAVDVVDAEGNKTGETEYYYTQRLNKNLTIDDVVDQFQKTYDLEFA